MKGAGSREPTFVQCSFVVTANKYGTVDFYTVQLLLYQLSREDWLSQYGCHTHAAAAAVS